MSGEHVLDDVAWHALTGPQAHLAEVSPDGRALRYRWAVGPFCGVGALDDAGWAAVRGLSDPDRPAVFLRGEVDPTKLPFQSGAGAIDSAGKTDLKFVNFRTAS